MNKRKHVSWNFNTQDLTLAIEEYNARYIQPGCIALANTMATETTPVLVTTRLNGKGKTELDALERWRPVPMVAAGTPPPAGAF